MGRQNLRNPYAPILSRMLASNTLPAVGASTCAAGNQVWKGNIGTLMAKAAKNARNTHPCRRAEYGWPMSSGIENVCG